MYIPITYSMRKQQNVIINDSDLKCNIIYNKVIIKSSNDKIFIFSLQPTDPSLFESGKSFINVTCIHTIFLSFHFTNKLNNFFGLFLLPRKWMTDLLWKPIKSVVKEKRAEKPRRHITITISKKLLTEKYSFPIRFIYHFTSNR